MSSVAWLIPQLIEGSGGHRTILQHAHALERAGHQCSLYIEGTGEQSKAADIISRMFGYHFSDVRFGWDRIQPCDLAIATVWYSAAFVRDLGFPCFKGYFVQDYEAFFNPMGDAFLMAENSFRYGLIPITIGRWLQHELSDRFDVPAYSYDFGADLSIYKSLATPKDGPAVCFIYQPDKPRRCSRIGIETLGIVKHHRPDVKIYLYGSRVSDRGHIWFEHEHLGLINLNECNALYNLCDVGLCLSSSNPSRIPFEMMAAGLPVVELWRSNNLYDIPSEAVSLCEQTPESLAFGILEVISNQNKQRAMSQAGIRFMTERSLNNETLQFQKIISEILQGKRPQPYSLEKFYKGDPVTSSEGFKCFSSEIHKRLSQPRRRILSSLPSPLRKTLKWGARTAQKLIVNS